MFNSSGFQKFLATLHKCLQTNGLRAGHYYPLNFQIERANEKRMKKGTDLEKVDKCKRGPEKKGKIKREILEYLASERRINAA